MNIEIHKQAQKKLAKAPVKIQDNLLEFIQCYMDDSIDQCRFEIVVMKGKYKIYKEVKLDKDYRVLFREEKNTLYIRYAGTHNDLGTG